MTNGERRPANATRISRAEVAVREVHRRRFLADMGMGFTGLALGAMLGASGVARSFRRGLDAPDGRPHFRPKPSRSSGCSANGGVSHMETFDPKPELNKYAGKTIAETPYQGTQDRRSWLWPASSW